MRRRRVEAGKGGGVKSHNHLKGARIYLRPDGLRGVTRAEKKFGWRNRVGDFIRAGNGIVFDPWFKPAVRGLHQYGLEDLNTLTAEVSIKGNARAIPSMWYMPLIGAGNFSDGFGFAPYVKRFAWKPIPMDVQAKLHPPKNPLLPYLGKLIWAVPKRWDNKLKKCAPNDEWLLWDLDRLKKNFPGF